MAEDALAEFRSSVRPTRKYRQNPMIINTFRRDVRRIRPSGCKNSLVVQSAGLKPRTIYVRRLVSRATLGLSPTGCTTRRFVQPKILTLRVAKYRDEIETESMVSRINARGMGLLEVVRSNNSDSLGGDEVDFLHRTVRDFFRLRAPEGWIAHRLPPSFNPDQLLCNATLAQFKTMSLKAERGLGKLLGLVDDMMRYAYNLEKDLEAAPTILLDNLAHTISQHIKVLRDKDTTRFLNNPQIRRWCNSFLSFAV